MDAICLKALEKQPEKRFASMKDLANELAEYLNSASDKKTNTGFSKFAYPLPPLVNKKTKTPLLPVVASILLAATFLLVGMQYLTQYSKNKSPERIEVIQATQAASQEFARLDQNQDEQLSATELASGYQQSGKSAAQALKMAKEDVQRFDRNGDQLLSLVERVQQRLASRF